MARRGSNWYKTHLTAGLIFLVASEWHPTLFSLGVHWRCDDFAPIPGILAEGAGKSSHAPPCYSALGKKSVQDLSHLLTLFFLLFFS